MTQYKGSKGHSATSDVGMRGMRGECALLAIISSTWIITIPTIDKISKFPILFELWADVIQS